MTAHDHRRFDRSCGRCWLAADELIGSEWDDKDPREDGRRVQIIAVVPDSDDGYGGPVYDALTIQNRAGRKVGRTTRIGAHGLRRRWREVESDGPDSLDSTTGSPDR